MHKKWYCLLLSLFLAVVGCKKEIAPTKKKSEIKTHAEQNIYPRPNYSKQYEAHLLITYLQHNDPDQQQMQEAQAIVDKAQVISLHYERDKPINDDSDNKARHILESNLQEKGAIVTLISHHNKGEIYPQLSVIFSRLFSYNLYKQPEPERWLDYMKLPINAGYMSKSARIVYIPAMETKKITFDKCNAIATQIADKFEHLQPHFKQLMEFDENKLTIGKWDNKEWPHYPKISYRFGFGAEIPNTKGEYEKTTENWCQIQLWFAPVTGRPQARRLPGKTYPRQGISACWLVNSADENFDKKISQMIVRELEPLNEYENKLEVKK